MSTRKYQINCYVTPDVGEAFARKARESGVSVSDACRALIERAVSGRKDDSSLLLRELLFIATGVDALLTTHPDSTLRAITLNAHQARLRSEGLAR